MNERTVTIVALAILGVVLLGGGGVIWYLNDTLGAKQKELKGLEAKVDDAKVKKGKIPELKKEIEGSPQEGLIGLQEKIEKAKEKIPLMDESEFDAMADLVDNLRKQSSTVLSDARFAPGMRAGSGPPIPPNMFRATYEVNVQGGFYNLLRLLNLFESQKRFVAVDNFQISEGAGTGRGSLVPMRDLRLTIYTFTRKPLSLPGFAPEVGTGPVIKAAEPEKPTLSTPPPN